MAKNFSVTINRRELLARQHRAFAAANADLHEAIVGEIASPVWDWDGTTYRRNGEVIGSPRNIIDEGELLEGARPPRMQGKTQCVHAFEAEHSLAVHNGAVLANGGVIQPRPFTERPIRAFPEMFAKAYRDGT